MTWQGGAEQGDCEVWSGGGETLSQPQGMEGLKLNNILHTKVIFIQHYMDSFTQTIILLIFPLPCSSVSKSCTQQSVSRKMIWKASNSTLHNLYTFCFNSNYMDSFKFNLILNLSSVSFFQTTWTASNSTLSWTWVQSVLFQTIWKASNSTMYILYTFCFNSNYMDSFKLNLILNLSSVSFISNYMDSFILNLLLNLNSVGFISN